MSDPKIEQARALIEAHFAPMGPSKADTIKALCELLDVGAQPVAAPLSDAQIFAIRDSIKTGDGWDGDQWDLTLARAVLARAPSDRIVALENKCALLAASLRQADELRDRLVEALKDAHPYVDHAGVRIAIGAALAAAGAV